MSDMRETDHSELTTSSVAVEAVEIETDLEQSEETRSHKLAMADSPAERRAIHEDYVVNHQAEFDEECLAVARLLNENDRERLVAHGSRFAAERAAAKAAAIRTGR